MRQRKLMVALFMLFVMVLTVNAPSMAMAKPNDHRPPAITHQQKQIHKNSVAHKKHEYRRANRANRAVYYYDKYNTHYYYAEPYYYSNYMNGRAAYRYSYNVALHPDYSAMAEDVLDAAYLSYLARTQAEQIEEVPIEPQNKKVVTEVSK